MKFSTALTFCAALLISGTQAGTASTIAQCPALAPRASPATNVNDLRADDIKVVAAIGDSIMAAFAAKGIQNGQFINIDTLNEYRGVSWGGGGDPSAVTLPNFIKNYNPTVKGASVSQHLAELCYGPLCPPFQYQPSKDVLNAAQSGGMAMDLDHELDYLLPALQFLPGIDYKNDWKLINLQIGSNDQCASCIDDLIPLLTPTAYGNHVASAIERIRKNVPRVLINLVGVFNVTQVYTVTANQAYCMPFKNSSFIVNSVECPCAIDAKNRPTIDATAAGYSQQLLDIYNKYKPLQTDSFAVIYTPANIDVASFPVSGLSNIDCFHPSELGHQFVAKTVWNTYFEPLANKPSLISWDANLGVYCPTEADRFQLS